MGNLVSKTTPELQVRDIIVCFSVRLHVENVIIFLEVSSAAPASG